MAEESKDPSVHELVLRRGNLQGELKKIYAELRAVLFEDDQDGLIKGLELIEKLTVMSDKQNHVNDELADLCSTMKIDDSSAEAVYASLREDCERLRDEALEWTVSVKALKARAEGHSTAGGSAPDPGSSNGRSSGQDHSTGAGEQEALQRVIQDQQSLIVDQGKKLDELTDSLQHLQSLGNQTMSLKDEVTGLREAMSRKQMEASTTEQQLNQQIMGLRKELENEKAKSRYEDLSSTRRDTVMSGHGRSSMSTDDVFAISHIMQKSSAELVRQVLDETHNQQKEFYQTMRAPRIEMKVFDGEVTEYKAFMNRFDDLVGNSDTSFSVKLNTLLQYCGPSVVKHLGCCDYLKPQEGYKTARATLQKLYGKPQLVIHAWMDKVMTTRPVKSAESMLLFVSDLRSCMKTLTDMNCLGELDNSDKKVMLLAKLPIYLQNRWRKLNRKANENDRTASLEDFITMIDEAAEEQNDPVYGIERINKVVNLYDSLKPKPQVTGRSTRRSYATGAGETEVRQAAAIDAGAPGGARPKIKSESQGKTHVQDPCECCKQPHFTRLCDKFKAMTSKEKLEFVRKQELCLLCLSGRHAVKDCRFTWRCQIGACEGKHNNVLHWGLDEEDKRLKREANRSMNMTIGTDDLEVFEESSDRPMLHLQMNNLDGPIHHLMGSVDDYAMPIAPCYVKTRDGVLPTNAMLDTGGGFSIISKRLRDAAGLKTKKQVNFRITTLSSQENIVADVVTVFLRGKRQPNFHIMFNAVVLDKKLVEQRYVEILKSVNNWAYLRDLDLPTHDTTNIDLLVGQDNAHLMKSRDLVEGDGEYSPFAMKTKLGWVIHGLNMRRHRQPIYMHYKPELTEDEVRLDSEYMMREKMTQALDRMQMLEEVPHVEAISPINKKILEYWDSEVKLVNGHVQVPMPFKEEDPKVPNNYEGVLRRHEALGRRLTRDASLKEKFVAATRETIAAGYAELVTEAAEEGREWYIPTQAVLSDNKPGVCRVVGDVSYQFKGVCLNEIVHQGPNMTTNLVDVTIKFRRYPVAITGDVKAMYNQVSVPSEQRDFLRFLYWRNDDPSDAVVKYRMTTEMFGGTWSPAASIYAFRWIAQSQGDGYDQSVIDVILKHFYVDDMLSSLLDVESGIHVITGVRELLWKGHFLLTKIGSHSLEVMKAVPLEHRAKGFKEVDLEFQDGLTENTLGSVWRPKQDMLGYKVIDVTKPTTRRGVLSTMSSLYDPLGLVSPFILLARILLQEVCKLKYDWDDELSEDLKMRWREWLTGLKSIQEFAIPRWLGVTGDEINEYQLHVFADASEQGYGVAIYLCVYHGPRRIDRISLVAAKSRVSPIKVVTIPRLELTAAVLGVKMEKSVKEYLDIPLKTSVYWTDSMIVLHYIGGEAWQFKTFISNRIAYIHEYTQVNQWRHVPGVMNVADIASRGLGGEELLTSTIWKQGPDFLHDVDKWPTVKPEKQPADQEAEMEFRKRYSFKYEPVYVAEKSERVHRMLEYFSDWRRLVKMVCWWHRYLKRLHGRKVDSEKSFEVGEVELAELKIIKLAQRYYLTEQQLTSKMFKKLYTFTSDDVLRVGGRLMNATLTYEERHPPVLPNCHVARLFIMDKHEKIGHGGVHRTFYECRKTCWILGGKPVIKRVLSSCFACKKMRGCVGEQMMAPLPKFRVAEGKAPFENVGVNFFGPILIKVGRGLHKRYGCVFTDLVMRAGHIEIVPDLTSSAFIDALQRFISRRGKPAMIASDNGTNFVGAHREMTEAVRDWNLKRVGNYMAREGIVWKFNTPTASHHGGVWERLIRFIRSLMMSLIKDQTLTEYGLLTYACLIEQILNSRPLTKMTEDPEDPLPISPEHLLNLRGARGIDGSYDRGDTIRTRWRQIQYLGDKFWQRWSAEYLRTLQRRPKWVDEQKNLKKGDLVLVLQEHTPRLQWPLGLIVDVVTGRDGLVRSVRVKTQKGEYVRPVTKVVGLECGE